MTEQKKFQRKIEDFKCQHCGHAIAGTGYTNHCPICLWSKHVDVNPGDRRSGCLGMMKPVSVEQKRGKYVIIHRCQACGQTKRNKAAPDDDLAAIIAISSGVKTNLALSDRRLAE